MVALGGSVVAIELVVGAQAADLRRPARLGTGTATAHARVREIVPFLAEGDVLRLAEASVEDHETQPPPRFNEASLVKFLEENGIGRPSTYAEIIGKVGAMVGRLTYGASRDAAVEHFQKALKLNPDSAIARIEYANGLVTLFGKEKMKEAERLYAEAAQQKPLARMRSSSRGAPQWRQAGAARLSPGTTAGRSTPELGGVLISMTDEVRRVRPRQAERRPQAPADGHGGHQRERQPRAIQP